MAVVRFIAHVAWSRNGNGPNHFPIIIGILVKIDDGKKVRSHSSLVARPDIESLGRLLSAPVSVTVAGAIDRIAKQVIFYSDHGRNARSMYL
jgi:hypothetical protein